MTGSETGLLAQILETATGLFAEKGYHGLSMRELADALGVSKAALYYYFTDKEGLFLAILRGFLDDMDAALERISAGTAGGEAQVRAFIAYVLTLPAQQRAAIRLASQEVIYLSPATREAFDALYREKFIDRLGAMLQAGMDAGEFRPAPAGVTLWALLGMLFPYLYATRGRDVEVPEANIHELAEIFLRGICR